MRILSSLVRKRPFRHLSSLKEHVVTVKTSEIGAKPVLLDRLTPLTWYACGPTVYDVAHLGHARNYVATDIIRRILTKHFGYQVNFAMGITDVDDKIIKKGKEKNCSSLQDFLLLAYNYELEFFRDMDQLNVERPHATLRVTEHIPDILQFIERLVDKKHAYIAKDGVYFDMNSLPRQYNHDKFGCAPVKASADESPSPSDQQDNPHSTHKKDARDFALWKRTDTNELVGWQSAFGYGRPGWHIECSAMTYTYFGTGLTIHSGGVDLKFPHHNNEILQSECHHCLPSSCISNPAGSSWVSAWIHTGHLHIHGHKMSKSLKNFISIQQYMNSAITSQPGVDFRLFILHHKYNAHLTYTEEHILLAAAYRQRLENFVSKVDLLNNDIYKPKQAQIGTPLTLSARHPSKPCPSSQALYSSLYMCQDKVNTALADDFDTPLALQAIGNLLSDAQKYLQSTMTQVYGQGGTDSSALPLEPLLAVRQYITQLFSASFGVNIDVKNNGSSTVDTSNNDAVVQTLVDFRARIRTLSLSSLKSLKDPAHANSNPADVYKKILGECDAVRGELAKVGVKVEDVGVGVAKWTKEVR